MADLKKTIRKLRAELKERDKTIAALLERIAVLEAEIAALKKNSSNSSKPPSSDIVKPPKDRPPVDPKTKRKVKRKRGGQKGHKQNLRKPLAPELIDEIVKLELSRCPECGHKLDLVQGETKVTQQIELVEKPFFATEYHQLMYWCEHCQCWHYRKLPDEVEKAGLFGPNMIALTAYLKGRCHVSYRTLQEYFRDVIGVDLSTGFLVKQVKKTSNALKSSYDELETFLKSVSHLHIDETSFKKNGHLPCRRLSCRSLPTTRSRCSLVSSCKQRSEETQARQRLANHWEPKATGMQRPCVAVEIMDGPFA